MKKNKLFIVILIAIIVICILTTQNLLLNNKLKEYKSANATSQPLIQNTVNSYDCEFTVTYRVVSLLEDYIYEIPEYSYIVVDKFQQNNPITHYISTELKNNLEVNKYYEFTYHIKGTGNINSIYDVINSIDSNSTLNVSLSIKKTDKLGLEQIQENICR